MKLQSAKTSLVVFGIYLMIIPGLGLMIIPQFILDLFGLHHGGILWMARMIGLLAFIIGLFDYMTGAFELKRVYKWTVVIRIFAAAFMAGLFLFKQVEIAILIFAAIDFLGAMWTAAVIND